MATNVITDLMNKISGLHDIPQGAHSIRRNGEVASMRSTDHIIIREKDEEAGLDIWILSECQQESLHMPVIIENEEIHETVYNTFYIGGGADVTIVAGCGMHNEGEASSQHDGIHEFYVGKWAKVKYVENHYGSGDEEARKVMNPQTIFHMDKDSTVILEMV